MPIEILRYWQDGAKAAICDREALHFLSGPKIGLVIGTFAAVPYIHLQLEAHRRFYPTIPLLIHDDASNRQGELSQLCSLYGVDFESNVVRQPPCVGDITAIAGGLLWAKEKGVDLLLKASRRWVFRSDWVTDLQRLALASDYATFCSYTTTFNFGFRTECVGMSVKSWTHPLLFSELTQPIREQKSVFVEAFIHNLARKLETIQSAKAELWRVQHSMPHEYSGYALWIFMGTDRRKSSGNFLWHDCNSPTDYYRTSLEWGLPYKEADFADPNQGEGNGVKK